MKISLFKKFFAFPFTLRQLSEWLSEVEPMVPQEQAIKASADDWISELVFQYAASEKDFKLTPMRVSLIAFLVSNGSGTNDEDSQLVNLRAVLRMFQLPRETWEYVSMDFPKGAVLVSGGVLSVGYETADVAFKFNGKQPKLPHVDKAWRAEGLDPLWYRERQVAHG